MENSRSGEALGWVRVGWGVLGWDRGGGGV